MVLYDQLTGVLGRLTALTSMEISHIPLDFTTLPPRLQRFSLDLTTEFSPSFKLLPTEQALRGCSHLTFLNLSSWQAPFPSNLQSLTALQHLRFDTFDYPTLHDVGSDLLSPFAACMTRLDLSSCCDPGLMGQVTQLSSLKELNISYHSVPDCGWKPFELRHLTYLSTGHCTEISHAHLGSLSRLTNLLHLCLSHTTTLPQSVFQLVSLRHLLQLDMRACNLVRLPRNLSGITSLRSLDVSANRCLRIAPDELEGLRHLTELDLTGCHFQLAHSRWMLDYIPGIRGLT